MTEPRTPAPESNDPEVQHYDEQARRDRATTTVEHVDGDVYRIVCTCGERVDYRFEEFTRVEALRHQRWHQEAGR